MQTLKSCPFCGAKPIYSRIPGSGFSIICPKCGAIALRDKNESQEYLAAGWNNRTVRYNFSAQSSIKACPFCSSRAGIGAAGSNQLIIKCSSCGMMVSFASAQNQNETITMWNRRV